MINAAKRANVNIYCFDLNGLRAPMVNPVAGQPMILDPGRDMREEMIAISNATGGDATVNTNRPTDGVPQIFVENGSYYLLGYVSTNTKEDGKLRRLEVQVNRPHAEVRFRHGYYAPPNPAVAAKTPPPPVTLNAIAGLLPNRAVSVDAVLVPVAVAGRREAAVAVAVGLRKGEADRRLTGTVELLTRAFTPVGDPRGEQLQRIPVVSGLVPGGRFDVLTQMALAPGRYEFRLSARDLTLDQTGSVYAYVDVPDFAREPLSLSGLVLSSGTTPASPRDAVADILPVVPTTQRMFGNAGRVTAFLRVYQGGRAALAPATVTVKILNDHDQAVVDRQDAIDAASFDATTRAFDYRFYLPLASLAPGEYLLTIDAALDAKRTATRTARFTIK